MEEMRELVDIGTAQTVVYVAAAVLIVAGIVVGVVLRARSARLALIRGGLVSVLGPMIAAAWHLYLHMTRFDPETGYFGLDKVWVLVVCVIVAIGVGAGYGYVAGRAWRPTEGDSAQTANEAGSTG